MKPYLKVPEGAPFWKYNVKDEVVTAPVKSYNFSRNPEGGHMIQTKTPIPKQSVHDFKCGRV